jgi:hypothetical protein
MSQLPKPPGRLDEKNSVNPSAEMFGAVVWPVFIAAARRVALPKGSDMLPRVATHIAPSLLSYP